MTIYDFTVKNNKGEDVSLEAYKNKVLLIVNTATHCGFTPQYKGLEELYEKYHDKGFEILDFPCNQFLNQAPESDADIQSFCTLNYNTKFDRFQKIDVNGASASPLYVYLKKEKPEDDFDKGLSGLMEKLKELGHHAKGEDIKWNFTKFLIAKDGTVVKRYAPTVEPEKIGHDIEEQLNK
ncbi:MAG: glutathione peroxidase [Christensenella sp.]|nr:glutathione peroxidase [Christensenella sp.]